MPSRRLTLASLRVTPASFRVAPATFPLVVAPLLLVLALSLPAAAQDLAELLAPRAAEEYAEAAREDAPNGHRVDQGHAQ